MIIKLQNGDKVEKGLFGLISKIGNKIKDRMYRTITPRGYHIGQATKEFIKGDTRDMSKFTPLENEVWAKYLGTKYEGASNLEPAIYRPTKGGATYDDVVKLKDESLILSDNVLKLLLDNYKKTGKKSMLVKGNETGLGTYTISMGEDEKGKYISYYDDWDINPTRGISAKYNIPILNLIGDIVPGTHPFSVYGRRYYKNGGLIRRMKDASGGPIHYSRTMTADNLSKAANYVGEYILKGLGAFGKIMTAPLTGGPLGPATIVLPKTRELLNAERKLRETQELLIGKAMTWVSPLNYGAALMTGNGLNAGKGEEEVASWSPAWLAVGRVGELYIGPKAVKGASRAAINTAARAGVKPAKAAVIAREINKGVNKNTPKYDNRIHSIRVDNLIYDYSSNPLLEFVNTIKTSPTNSYFMRAPSKIDITKLHNGRFRHEVVGNNILSSGEVDGKFVSYGEPWKEFGFGEGSALYEFPVGPKRGPNMMATDWKGRNKDYSVNEAYDYMKLEELLREDLRLLNKQMGELFDKNYATIRNNLIEAKYPLLKLHIDTSIHGGNQTVISNLKWNFNNFLNSPFYKYTIDPISNQVQKELVISGVPNKSVEPSTSLAFFERKPSTTIQISPEELYKVFKDQELNGYYFMGHGTGRTNVNPLVIFDNGLRIKSGDIGNTTSPISESNLTLWPHANSKEVIILPAKAEKTKIDSAHGHIPTDWYDSKTFQWDDNPGFEGSGFFAVLKPNATFVETEINGVPGVYTKPEAILGSYNIDTHTLKLNPKSLYEFLFNAPRTIIKNKEVELYALRDNTGGSSKITVPDVYKSLTEAAKYKSSKGYKDLVHRAQKEAEEMGLPFSPDLYLEVNKHLPSIKLNSRPKGKLGGYRRSTNTIELDPDLLSPIEGKYVPFHEGLHWLRVGTPEMNSPLYNRWKENMQNDLAWGEFYRSEEYKNLALQDNAKAYARKKVKEALYEDADPYLSTPGELLINGLEAGRAIGLEPFAEYPGYGKALKAAEKARNYNKWLYDVKAGTTLEMLNFWKILTGNYIPTVSIPLTTGYTLYNLFGQPLQQLQYLKQGGKMLIYLKNGNKIHIKKKNRGKFTAYCGGNVTSACIAKAKASGNPTLVKRATFADNARKWKHLKGGVLDKISDAYLKLSDSPIASTIYDTVNAGLYLAAPFTGGATLIPAMAMTGLLAGGATANALKKGLNILNGLDIASAIPGFGLTEKAVKASMKPVMRMVGKTTKKISRATKYRPINDKILVTAPDGRIFNFGKYRPTYWQMASWDKKYAPYAALVYGEDALNHGLNVYQVVKDVKQRKKGGKLCLIPRN